MRVKISWDEGNTFERTCELDDCIQKEWDAETYHEAKNELGKTGRYWLGGGAAPLCLLMVDRDPRDNALRLIDQAIARRSNAGLVLRFNVPDRAEVYVCYPSSETVKAKWISGALARGWTLAD